MSNYDFILSMLVGKSEKKKLYVSKTLPALGKEGIAILSSEDIDESFCFESMQEAKTAIDSMVYPYNQNSFKIEIYVRKTGKLLTESQTAKLSAELAKLKPASVVRDRTNTKVVTGAPPKAAKAKKHIIERITGGLFTISAAASKAGSSTLIVENPRKPGVVAEIIALHVSGKSKADIIAAGYNKNTVNRQVGEYIKTQKPKL